MGGCAAAPCGYPELLIALGAVVLVVTVGRLLARGRRGRADADGGEAERQVTRVREAGDEVLARVESLGRDTLARIETRIHVLDGLLARAEALRGTAPAGAAGARGSAHDEVCRLADEGLDSAGIAGRTGLERSEVELVLGLRRKAREQGAPASEGTSPHT